MISFNSLKNFFKVNIILFTVTIFDCLITNEFNSENHITKLASSFSICFKLNFKFLFLIFSRILITLSLLSVLNGLSCLISSDGWIFSKSRLMAVSYFSF